MKTEIKRAVPITEKAKTKGIYKDAMDISVGADGSGGAVPEIDKYDSPVKKHKDGE